jgi:hypothetical protein
MNSIHKSERVYGQLQDADLFDAWEQAYNLWAQDYRVAEARVLVDQLSLEIKARGLRRPIMRVGQQITAIASQIRADDSRKSDVSENRLSDDLTSFLENQITRSDKSE